jgi:cobalt/nickel transport system permease protein
MGLQKWSEVGRMDELGRLASPAHRVDARAKALATAGFLAAVLSFPRYEVAALTPFALFPFALGCVGRIPAAVVLRKLLVAAPFAVAVGLFNPFLDAAPMGEVAGFAVTGGWLSFASILLRFALTVSAALVLVACTGMDRLCAGLARLGLPRVFVVQLLFLHRYLFAIADEGARMLRGLELRAAGRPKLRLRVYGSLVGHLLVRSMARAERVYQAMLARGFDGEVRVLQASRLRPSDVAFVCGWLAFFAAARRWNLAAALGALLAGGAP